MKNIIFLLMFLTPVVSNAGGYIGNKVPSLMFGAGQIMFGVDAPPGDTCDHYSRHFKFDAVSESGKNMLSVLLAAMLANKKIDIWYTGSTAPGTNENNGCHEAAMATMTHIGIR